MKTEFSPDWKNWIKTNVNAGQCRDGIFKILIDEGYAVSAIKKEMNYFPKGPLSKLQNPFEVAAKEAALTAQRQQAQQTQIQSGQTQSNHLSNHQSNQVEQPKDFEGNNGAAICPSRIHVPNAIAYDSSAIDLRTVDNFLTHAECEKLIARIKPKLRPSQVSDFQINSDVRTSQTCDLGRLEDPFIREIDERICKLIGINPAYSEVIQGQYYEVGQEFKAHTDFFDPAEFETHCHTYGQRTYTVMIYLNDVENGGETCFNRIGAEFKPLAGKLVLWNSLNPDGTTNMDSLHQANPVEKGFKAVITKWFRSKCPDTTGGKDTAAHKMFTKELNEYVQNYTVSGLHKIDLPKPIFKKINQFYHENRKTLTDEYVQGGFIYEGDGAKKKRRTSSSLVNLTPELRQEVHDRLKPLMEDWCGQTLEPTFVYGIREYHHGAVLKMHRDRVDTHIISAIINVDQETDVDWPLIIEDNAYRTHQIMIKPGEVILYEGGRLLHGRPIMFEGESFANMFCHFKPVGYIAPS